MTWLRGRWLPLGVLVAAVGLLIASVAWTAAGGRWGSPGYPVVGPGGMMGPGMAGVAIRGDGPVRDLDAAERAATRFADRWALTVGEVTQFDNGYYAELVDSAGQLATEVLVDTATGDVHLEYGPAMMWNTAYGMHPARPMAATVTGPQARSLADQWLATHRSGEYAGDAEPFPGYYTLDTLRGGQLTGMLSVNAFTGTVWYHSWHGRFIAMKEYETK